MLRVICPSTFPGLENYEVCVSQTLKIFRFCSPNFEHVWRIGRQMCFSPARQRFLGQKRSTLPSVLSIKVMQSKNSVGQVSQVSQVSQPTPPALLPSPLNDPKRPYTHTRTQVIRTDVR